MPLLRFCEFSGCESPYDCAKEVEIVMHPWLKSQKLLGSLKYPSRSFHIPHVVFRLRRF